MKYRHPGRTAALCALSAAALLFPLPAAASTLPAAAAEPERTEYCGETPQYSSRVILAFVDRKLSARELDALLEKYNLSLVYDYENFNLYALSADQDLTRESMQKLIQGMEKEKHILSVSRDEILTLEEKSGTESGTEDCGYGLQ